MQLSSTWQDLAFSGQNGVGAVEVQTMNESDGNTSKEMCRTEKRSGVFLSVLRGTDPSKSHYILSAEQLGQTAGVPDPSISKRIRGTTCPTQHF